MSIIYDALKKVEASNIQKLKVQPPKDSKSNFKIYFIYILVACAGATIAGIFLGLFTKPLQVSTPSQTKTKAVAKKQTIATEVLPEETSLKEPEETSLKETEPISLTEQIQKQSLPSLVLNGVFFSQDEGYALINNRIVKKGDVIEGAIVRQIALNEVELELEGSIIKLSTNH